MDEAVQFLVDKRGPLIQHPWVSFTPGVEPLGYVARGRARPCGPHFLKTAPKCNTMVSHCNQDFFAVSQQSEKFLFQQSRKFLLKSVKLAG